MNLDINYFCTYDEQIELLKYFIDRNNLTVFIAGTRKSKDVFLVNNFDEEIKKTIRKANTHNRYLFNYGKDVEIRDRWIKGENTISYSLGPSDTNCNGINVYACSYEDDLILFGRIASVYVNDTKIEAFKDLKKYMRGKFKKYGRWYVPKTIVANKENYRLETVVGDLHPDVFLLKI